MAKKVTNKTTPYLLVFFVVVGIFLRFWQLNTTPISLYMDEMDHVVTGATLRQFGTDLSGQWRLHHLQPYPALNVVAELPSVFFWLFQSISNSVPAQTAHLVAAIFGLATIAVSYYLLSAIEKKEVSLITMAPLLLNPWHIFLSRMAYEAAISLFFQVLFILGISISIFREKKTTKTLILACVLIIIGYFFAYFTYHGAKFTLVAIGIISIIAQWWLCKDKKRNWIISAVLLLAIVGSALHTLNMSEGTRIADRSNELIISPNYLNAVATEHIGQSINNPLLRFFENKLVILVREAIIRYASVFDVYRLFVSGTESGFQFSLVVTGFFYVTQLVLIVIGFKKLYKTSITAFYFFSLLLLVSPVTSTITVTYQSIFRSALTYLLINLISGVGLLHVVEYWNKGKLRVARFVLIGILFLEVFVFSYNYFFRFPLLTTENFDFHQKVLSSYVERTTGPTLIVVDKHPYLFARALLVYTDFLKNMQHSDLGQFQDVYATEYQLLNIRLTANCPHPSTITEENIIISAGKMSNCEYETYYATTSATIDTSSNTIPYKALSSPKDSGAYFYLITDKLCSFDQTTPFIRLSSLEDLSLRKLSNEDFCKKWVKKENKAIIQKTEI